MDPGASELSEKYHRSGSRGIRANLHLVLEDFDLADDVDMLLPMQRGEHVEHLRDTWRGTCSVDA